MSETSTATVTVEHVTIRSTRDFDTVRQALKAYKQTHSLKIRTRRLGSLP